MAFGQTESLQANSLLCGCGISGLDMSVKGHLKSPWFQGINPREICCKQGQKPQYQTQFRWAAAVAVFRLVTVTVQLQPLLPPLPLSHKAYAEMSYTRTARDEAVGRGGGRKERREGTHVLNLP